MTERKAQQLPSLRNPEGLMPWATGLVRRLNAIVATVERYFPGERYTVLKPREAAVGALPPAGGLERILILVEDDGSRSLIWSDGAQWQRVSTGTNPAS